MGDRRREVIPQMVVRQYRFFSRVSFGVLNPLKQISHVFIGRDNLSILLKILVSGLVDGYVSFK